MQFNFGLITNTSFPSSSCVPEKSWEFPATSERAFSISGQISCKKRSSLSSKKIEELSIIRLNKETIARYKEFHKVEPKSAMDARIKEVLTDREDSDSDTEPEEPEEELDDFYVDSDFEEDDLNDD